MPWRHFLGWKMRICSSINTTKFISQIFTVVWSKNSNQIHHNCQNFWNTIISQPQKSQDGNSDIFTKDTVRAWVQGWDCSISMSWSTRIGVYFNPYSGWKNILAERDLLDWPSREVNSKKGLVSSWIWAESWIWLWESKFKLETVVYHCKTWEPIFKRYSRPLV